MGVVFNNRLHLLSQVIADLNNLKGKGINDVETVLIIKSCVILILVLLRESLYFIYYYLN